MLDFTLSEKETERRKQLIRDVWDYKKVDHFPVMLEVHSNPKKYTIHDEYFSKEKQLEIRLESIGKTLKYIPDDYIPLIFADVGCVGIESALGMELYYGETPNQTPGIRQYMFDGFDEIDTLKHINPYTDGILPEFLERLSYFAKETNYQLPITCLDMNGPMAIAMNIVGSENFLLGMYTEPE